MGKALATPHLLTGAVQSGETSRAVQACNDYLRLGPGRSLLKVIARYAKMDQTEPPGGLQSLKNWSARFDWPARAAAYDAAQDTARTAARQREFQRGLALDFARVRKLKRLAAFLEGQLYEQDVNAAGEETYPNVWLPDVKAIGSGPMAERVDLERFNGDLISQYRDTLADLAKETGGRVQKVAPTTPDGARAWQPDPRLTGLPDEKLAQLETLLAEMDHAGAGPVDP